jgi:hypothetical protein
VSLFPDLFPVPTWLFHGPWLHPLSLCGLLLGLCLAWWLLSLLLSPSAGGMVPSY